LRWRKRLCIRVISGGRSNGFVFCDGISPDTLNEESRNTNEQPAYRVQIKTKERKFQGPKSERIEIQPGMTATIEIKTGSNTILRYLTKPVTKTISESMGER
jgi:adhesin transport system membrane fusion protein